MPSPFLAHNGNKSTNNSQRKLQCQGKKRRNGLIIEQLTVNAPPGGAIWVSHHNNFVHLEIK
jgi:hypothetical protein